MNEQQQMIKDTLGRLLTDLCTPVVVDAAESGTWPGELWNALAETGLTVAGLPEAAGGTGGEIDDSLLVLRETGRFGAPVPVAEHFMAGLLLAENGGVIGTDPVTVGDADFSMNGDRVSGVADGVAFARWCQQLLVVADGRRLCLVNLPDCQVTPGVSVAGEPRDRVEVDCVPASVLDCPADTRERLLLLGAATRASLMAGALEAVLEMSVQYSLERIQFGRPISKFQAIQQQLATLAGDVAAATMAALVLGPLDETDIAIAKARVGEAVSVSTDIAHQVHGAMGYTMEHSLNQRTRRLWCWRDEYGNERFWQERVGRAFAAGGADSLWNAVTARR